MPANHQYGTVTGSVSVRGAISGRIGVGSFPVHELRFMPLNEFPEIGDLNVLYIDTSGDAMYYWDGSMYRSLGSAAQDMEIIAKSTAEWASSTTIVSKLGGIYIYTDYRQESNVNIPAIKIGDGLAYVVDLPFFDTGVTETDREFWNNKISAKMSTSDPETLVLYTTMEG